jgi:hypothetical protein
METYTPILNFYLLPFPHFHRNQTTNLPITITYINLYKTEKKKKKSGSHIITLFPFPKFNYEGWLER